MAQYNAKNERIKRQYLTFLSEAKRQSEASVDSVAAALARFEQYTRHRDFKTFHHQQATAFKRHLADQHSQATGEKLSKATQYATLSHLKRFFQWLAGQPGYKSSVTYSDAEYFNLPEKESRIATARGYRQNGDQVAAGFGAQSRPCAGLPPNLAAWECRVWQPGRGPSCGN